jgi:Subtilase family
MLVRFASRRFLSRLLTSALLAGPLFALVPATPAGAAPAPAVKLDPKVVRAIRTGLIGSWRKSPPQPGSAPVLIELAQPATPASLAALRSAGAQLAEVDGRVLFYDRFVPARVGAAAAAALVARVDVARVSLLPARGPLPLDHSAELIRLADARGARPALDLMTGEGVVIGDIDTLVDVFHPTFFRGDAGYYDWIDVDHDGVLTPGVDAVDLNRNGKVDPGETVQVVTAATYSDDTQSVVAARPAGFDPSIDWLYLDTNANQQRDFGAAAGFDDTTPAFGEPLFVPDDVNRNGKIDVGERVVRLGTSKFRDVYVRLDYQPPQMKTVTENHVFTRGKDLSTIKTDYFNGGVYGYADAFHATGVLTIIAGDVPLVGRRWVGLAPDAELIVGWEVEDSESLPATATTWALGEKPDVMLYEMAPWTGVALDGTDPISQLIDTSNQNDGVVHTCPTGDQGSARKHAHADLAAGAAASLPVNIPLKDKEGYGPLTYVDLSIHVRGGVATGVVITSPGNEVIDAMSTNSGSLMNGSQYYPTQETTTAGTQLVDVILYSPAAGMPLVTGVWTVTVTGDAAQAVSVDTYVSDDKSSWGAGAEWDPSVATDTSTLGVPSTADHCIAVNAHPNHVQQADAPWYTMYYGDYEVPASWVEAQGQLRAYCPLGPRIDGLQKPDVTAPDNPWVAAEYDPGVDFAGYGAFRVFGGTSGASPHVTGTAALLAQAGIHGDAARDAIRSGAVSDATTGKTPNAGYGYGRLDTAGALGVETVGGTPTITLAMEPAEPTTKDTVTLTPTATTGEASAAGLQIKWDDGYDGTWDVPYGPVAPRQITSATPAKLPFKARVRNASGHIAEAVVWVTFSAAPTPPPGMTTSVKSSSGCGCREAREAPGAGVWAVLGAAALLGARRRRSAGAR